MKEEPATQSLSRRTLLGRAIQGLRVTFALGYMIPRVQAEEGAVSKKEVDRLLPHTEFPLLYPQPPIIGEVGREA